MTSSDEGDRGATSLRLFRGSCFGIQMEMAANLQILNLFDCGLVDLRWISFCPNLRELYAGFNSVTGLDALWGMDRLEVIDLEANELADEFNLMILSTLPNLHVLTLTGNPVWRGSTGELKKRYFPSVAVIEEVEGPTRVLQGLFNPHKAVVEGLPNPHKAVRMVSAASTRPSTGQASNRASTRLVLPSIHQAGSVDRVPPTVIGAPKRTRPLSGHPLNAIRAKPLLRYSYSSFFVP